MRSLAGRRDYKAADMEGQMQCKSQRKQDWFEIQNNTDPKRPMQKSPGNDDGDGAPSPEVKNTGHNVVGVTTRPRITAKIYSIR